MGNGTNIAFAIPGEGAQAGTSQSKHVIATSSQPRCTVKGTGLFLKMRSHPPTPTPMNQNLPGWGEASASLEAPQMSLCYSLG